MKQFKQSSFLALGLIMGTVWLTSAQTAAGSSLSYRSSGSGSGNWTLRENGYVGTYFSLAAPGSVTLAVNASGSTNDAVDPRMNLVVADTNIGFNVAAGFNNHQHTFDLPAGSHFIRTGFADDNTPHMTISMSNPSAGRFHLSTATETAPLFLNLTARINPTSQTLNVLVQPGQCHGPARTPAAGSANNATNI